MNIKYEPNKIRRTAALILFTITLLSLTLFGALDAYADDAQTAEPAPAQTAQPTGSPQPSEYPAPSDTQSGDAQGTLPNGERIVTVDGMPCVEGEVIVKFDVSATNIMSVLSEADGGERKDMPEDGLIVARVPEGSTIEGFIEQIEQTPGVEYAQPNYVYRLERTVNDQYANPEYQWYLDTVNAYGAWEVTMGSPDIKVADLDTGIDLNHEEFAGQIDSQWDFVNDDDNAQDDNGHGTFTAGIIAAKADNGTGIAGISSGARLVAVKVLDAEGHGTTENICRGIDFAVSHGAKVINMSFGGYGNDVAMESAVNRAVSKGVVCVAAAGNDNTDQYMIPSDYDACISVIATDRNNVKTWYSNYGAYKDICAPGGDPRVSGGGIYSTCLGGGYVYMSGTSAACPVVSATAALMLSANPSLTVSQVKNILYGTAVYVGSANFYGHGLVNAQKAVFKASKTKVSVVSAGYNSAGLSWNGIGNADGYEIWRSSNAGKSYSLIGSTAQTSFTDAGLRAGTTYYYRVRAFYNDGSEKFYCSLSDPASARPLPGAPSSLNAVAVSYNKIKVSWSAVTGATGYRVYRAASLEGKYFLVKTTRCLSFTNSGLRTGTAYYYKVRAYTGSTSACGAFSGIAGAAPALQEIEWANAFSYHPTSVKLDWDGVPGRTGYEVWRSDSEDGTYNRIKTTPYTRFTNTGLTPFKTYYYKIIAYRYAGSKRVYNNFTTPVSATPVLDNVTGLTATAVSASRIRLSWKHVAGRSGYEIRRSQSAGGEFVPIGSTRNAYFYDSNAVSGATYYYKVYAYVNSGGMEVYSKDSPEACATP